MIGDGIGGSNYISRMQFCLCLMLAWLFASHWKTLIARYEGAINGHCQTQCVLWYHIYCEVKREGCDGQGGGVALSLCLQHWYPTFVSHFIKSAKDEIFSQTPEVQGLTVGGCRTPHTAHAQVHTIATPECLCVCLCVYVCVCVCVCLCWPKTQRYAVQLTVIQFCVELTNERRKFRSTPNTRLLCSQLHVNQHEAERVLSV